jgi:flagellar biosynthesis protein FlhB
MNENVEESKKFTKFSHNLIFFGKSLLFIQPFYRVQKVYSLHRRLPFSHREDLKFGSYLDCFNFLKMHEGFGSLWIGLLPCIFDHSISTYLDERVKFKGRKLKILPKPSDPKNFKNCLKFFSVTFCKEMVKMMLTAPIINMKYRMMLDLNHVKKYENLVNCMTQVFQQEGLTGFYKGIFYNFLGSSLIAIFKTLEFCYCYNDDQEGVEKQLGFGLLKILGSYPFFNLTSREVLKAAFGVPGGCELDGGWGELYRGVGLKVWQIGFCYGLYLFGNMIEAVAEVEVE